MKRNLLLAVLSILTVLLFYKVSTYYEYVEEEIDLGWGKEAQRNPFLAAQLLLHNKNTPVTNLDRYPDIASLPVEDTLIMTDSKQVYSDRLISPLINWIEQGGHLIVGASSSSLEGRDPLLSYLDLSIIETECDCEIADFSDIFSQGSNENNTEQEEENEEDKQPNFSEQLKNFNDMVDNGTAEAITKKENDAAIVDPQTPKEQLTHLTFTGFDAKIKVDFNSNFSLDHPYFHWNEADSDNENEAEVFEGLKPIYWVGDNYGVHFVQFELGNGLVSILSSSRPFKTEHIGHFDHAYFLSVISNGSTQVNILYGVIMPSLRALITQYAPELLFSFCLWLLGWILYRWQRFGPTFHELTTIRRSLKEHILASAEFIWHSADKQNLILPIQKSIHHNAAIQLAGYEGMNTEGKCLLLCDLTGLSKEAIGLSLSEAPLERKDLFYEKIKTLQIIETHLKNTA